MTILFPDVSSYTPNVDPSKYLILIARATLSDRVADPTYSGFKQKATAAGTVFLAYHWLNHGNLKAQAKWCFQHVGPDVPLMIDAEDVAGNTGYAGPLTVADITGFAAEYRALGGTVCLAYLPHWYWQDRMGSPDLRPLEAAGLHLVSSNYPNAGYTEDGPGWAAYGGVSPVQWQYSSTPIDMNAYRGTVEQFRQMIGGDMLTDAERAALLAGDLEQQDNVLHWRLRLIQDSEDPLALAMTFNGAGKAPAPGLKQLAAKLDGLAGTAPGAPVDVTALAAKVDALTAKLDQLLARLAAAGDALDG